MTESKYKTFNNLQILMIKFSPTTIFAWELFCIRKYIACHYYYNDAREDRLSESKLIVLLLALTKPEKTDNNSWFF